jgi:hypothetical protein
VVFITQPEIDFRRLFSDKVSVILKSKKKDSWENLLWFFLRSAVGKNLMWGRVKAKPLLY